MTRLIAGGIMHETHTFSAEPTTLQTLDIFRGEELEHFAGTNHSLGGAIDRARERGSDLALTFFAHGVSTGTPSADTFDALTSELCQSIENALPADGIILALHGAMVAENALDAEAEIVHRVRQVAGPDLPIAVTLDFHANIGQALVDGATVITTYDTYPHIDAGERAREAVDLLLRVIEGSLNPTKSLVKPPLLPVPQAMFTAAEPFRSAFERAHALESQGGAVTITIAGGFPYADVPEAGVSLLVTTHDDPAAARRHATEIATMLWDARELLEVRNVSPAAAVAEAIASDEWPVVLVDVGDNIGGGTPGDGTVLLAELLRQGARDAVIVVNDPDAAAAAHAAGEGSEVTLSVGGHVDRLHGEPVRVTGRVQRLTDGRWVHEGPENAGVPVDMGSTALVRVEGVDLILTTHKTMPGDLQQLRSVGIDPASRRILVVKAAVRWRGGYAPVTRKAILVDTPGLGSTDLLRFEYHHIRRPIFPLDPETSWNAAN
jgi:microcystin degradation protein MlrC